MCAIILHPFLSININVNNRIISTVAVGAEAGILLRQGVDGVPAADEGVVVAGAEVEEAEISVSHRSSVRAVFCGHGKVKNIVLQNKAALKTY